MLVFVQPNKSTIWLQLWKLEDKRDKKGIVTGKVWKKIGEPFPFEYEDSRFKICMHRRKKENLFVFKVGEKPGINPVKFDDSRVKPDLCLPPEEFVHIDFSAFWKSQSRRIERERFEKQIKKDPLRAVASLNESDRMNRLARLKARYK